MNYNKLNTPWNHCHSLLWNTLNKKGYHNNDTHIWIVTNIFLVAILFFFHHSPSVWTHRSLRLWWQQLLSLSDPLFPVDCCYEDRGWCSFVCHGNTLHAFQACNLVFYFPNPLCSHKLLLQQPPFHFQKSLRDTKLRYESKLTLKRTFTIFTFVSSNASILNWNDSK